MDAAGEGVLDHVQRAGAAGGGQLLLVQPQSALVVVDQHRGDAQVGLQHVVVDRVGVGEDERAPEGLRSGRPVAAGDGAEPVQQGPAGPHPGRRVRRGLGHQRGRVHHARGSGAERRQRRGEHRQLSRQRRVHAGGDLGGLQDEVVAVVQRAGVPLDVPL